MPTERSRSCGGAGGAFGRTRRVRRALWSITLGMLALVSLEAAAQPTVAPAPHTPVARVGASRQEFELSLRKGEQEVLPAQGVKSFSEAIQGIIDVRLTGDATRFVVVGKAAGTTSLLFLMADGTERNYRVTVTDPDAALTAPQGASTDVFAVQPKANVRLDLYFVQLERSYSHAIGMNAPTTFGTGTFNYGYDLAARALVSNTAVIGAELLPTLELGQTQGWVKVTRHVAVITTNGTEATFDSGGEFNVAVAQGLTATVQSINFGTVLSVRPLYDEETQRMEMLVTAEVADLASTTAAIPGRNRSKLKTVANLALGESLAVAGVTSKLQEEQRAGVPWLSQIPVLGLLFGKHNRQAKETENMVFIVPSVVEPMQHPRAKEFLDESLRAYDAYEGKLKGIKLMPARSTTTPQSSKSEPQTSQEPSHAGDAAR